MKSAPKKTLFIVSLCTLGVIMGLILSLLLQSFGIRKVTGESMEPNLRANQFIALKKVENNTQFDYNDIVAFDGIRDTDVYIKRIIGKPGDTIEFINGQLYRNNIKTYESYVKYPDNITMPKITLDKDEYFCCGDNRPVSVDCRSFGAIKKKQIKEKLRKKEEKR